jgi:hypothetical protein
MLDDIIYDSLFMTFEVDEQNSSNPITSLSFDGENYDFTAAGGETTFVFID